MDGNGGSRNDFVGSAGQIVQASSIGTVTFAAAAAPPSVPAQVPPPPEGFVNRAGERRRLRELAAQADSSRPRPVVGVLAGMRGVGKTALLRMATSELSGDFADGALHVVYGPEGQSPAEAAARMLVALGVPEPCVPADFAQRVDLYRSLTARSRMLVVFDEVTDPAQVIALLPNSGSTLVLVAGNTALEELFVDGAVPLTLEPLPVEHGVALLRQVCPDRRFTDEPDAAGALVELCGGLPLALRVAGAHLAVRPHLSVRRLVDELRAGTEDGPKRRGVLDRVFTVFDTVYAELADELRTLYRVLGVLVGTHFRVELVAAVQARHVGDVQADIEELCLTGLAEQRPDQTYQLHRLVRSHALRMSQAEDTETSRIELLRRAVDWWLLGATAADVAVTGSQRLRIADPDRLLGPEPPTLDRRAALEWFDQEHANIAAAMEAAAAQGWHARVWQLFEALFAYLDARRPLALWTRTATLAVESAHLDKNRAAEARCRCLLAKAYQEWERYPQARAELDKARDLADGCGDRLRASTFDFTGNLSLREGRPAEALSWFRKALDINIQLGTGRGTALQTLFVGRALGALGETDEAVATFASARSLAEAAGVENLVPRILLSTAHVLLRSDHLAEAEHTLADAHERASELGLTAVEADIAKLRGTAAARRGEQDLAATYLRQAIAAYERMGSPRAAHILAGLSETDAT